jgi:hypothetical protein
MKGVIFARHEANMLLRSLPRKNYLSHKLASQALAQTGNLVYTLYEG